LKEAKKSRQLSNYKKRNRANSNLSLENAKEEDEAYADFCGYKLPLFSADRMKQIGVISLR